MADDDQVEDHLLEEEEQDVSQATNRSSYSEENPGLMALLTSMNTAITALSESLLKKGETKPPEQADSANKRKASTTEVVDDADQLLGDSKRQKVSNDICEDDDALLTEIAQSINEEEKTDPKISAKLAEIIEGRWLNKLSDDHLKEKTAKYLRPANCERFISPKVNPEIWERLDRQARGKDLKLSGLQTLLTKVGYITAKATDILLQSRRENKAPDTEELVRMNSDVICLLGHMSFEMSQRRRDAIRPVLNKDYATLCASHIPITKWLFGDELQTQLNHIRASNKISNTASSSTSAYKGNSRFHNPSRTGSKKPFLSKGSHGSSYHNRRFNHNRNFSKKSITRDQDQKQ